MGIGKPDLWKAKELAEANAQQARELTSEFDALRSWAERVDADYNAALREVFDRRLVPFAELMAQVKNVELEELVTLEAAPQIRSLNPQTRQVSLDAVKGLVSVAGGAAAGAGAGAATFAAVGLFAAASTGTAISSLSGAAATSATLAWLGGGSLAAGGAGVAGGTAVLAGVVVLPVVLAAGGFLWWQGSRELSKQRQVQAELTAARSELGVQRHRVEAAHGATGHAMHVLWTLGERVNRGNACLRATLARTDDYRLFTADERADLAIHVSAVVAITAVMSAPLLGRDGMVTEEFRDVLGRASDLATAA